MRDPYLGIEDAKGTFWILTFHPGTLRVYRKRLGPGRPCNKLTGWDPFCGLHYIQFQKARRHFSNRRTDLMVAESRRQLGWVDKPKRTKEEMMNSPEYISTLLGCKSAPKELIDLKREHLKLYRLLNMPGTSRKKSNKKST